MESVIYFFFVEKKKNRLFSRRKNKIDYFLRVLFSHYGDIEICFGRNFKLNMDF